MMEPTPENQRALIIGTGYIVITLPALMLFLRVQWEKGLIKNALEYFALFFVGVAVLAFFYIMMHIVLSGMLAYLFV